MRFGDYPQDGEVICLCQTHPNCNTKLNRTDHNCWRCGCIELVRLATIMKLQRYEDDVLTDEQIRVKHSWNRVRSNLRLTI